MTVFYWPVDISTWILQPQVTRWRSRYRGQRESWKINLEICQIGYDINQLYSRSYNDQLNFESQISDLEFGKTFTTNYNFNLVNFLVYDSNSTYDQNLYDAATPSPLVVSPLILDGSQEIVRRLQRLLYRVSMLENSVVFRVWDKNIWDQGTWL